MAYSYISYFSRSFLSFMLFFLCVTACISFAGSFSDLRYSFLNRHCSSSKRNVCVIHISFRRWSEIKALKPLACRKYLNAMSALTNPYYMKYVLVFACMNLGLIWFTAEATSLTFTYTPYVFETFLQVVEILTSLIHDIKVFSSPWKIK